MRKNKLPAVDSYDNQLKSTMTDIAMMNSNTPAVSIDKLSNKQIDSKIKLFLIAQVERELIRVIKLTDLLDRMQDIFMSKVNECERNQKITLEQCTDIINTITGLIDRSGKIISNLYHDDSVKNLLIVDNSGGSLSFGGDSNNVAIPSTVLPGMEDRRSRDKVRLVIEAAIRNIRNSNPIDVTEDKPEEDNGKS